MTLSKNAAAALAVLASSADAEFLKPREQCENTRA
jgi:hypothetical protein